VVSIQEGRRGGVRRLVQYLEAINIIILVVIMPKVPTYDNFQTTPTTLPQAQLSAPQMPDIAGQQLQQLGQGMQQAGQQFGRIALDMQQQANQIRVDDAINQAKESAMKLAYDKDAGYTNLRGINALQRESGRPMAEEYTDNLREQMRNIAGTLGNDAQREAFRSRTQDLVGNFWAQATKHEADQFQEYALSVREGTINNQVREIGLNYRDPNAVDSAVKSIQAAAYDQGRLLGKSAEWSEAQAVKATSNAHVTAIMAALQDGNPMYAQAYLNKYSGQMEANDILRVRGVVTEQTDAQVATVAASGVIQQVAPRYVTSDMDRAFNIAIGTESGGRQFDSAGQPLTSSKGAIGVAQVMPATAPEAAKIAGLPWDEQRYKNDAAYNEALGRAYFQRQLQAFGGNLPQAYAAYNAGPKATQDAVDKASKEGGVWLAYLPKETQDYVAKNMAAYNAGGGQYEKPSLNQVLKQVEAVVGTDSPQRLKLAKEEAARQFEVMTKEVKQRDDESVANAMRELVANGGRFSQLPPAIRASLPPDKVSTVMEFGGRIAKGDDLTSPALYQKLASEPDYLKGLSDNEFYQLRGQLSEADFKKFAQERGDLLTGNNQTSATNINSTTINNVLNDRLRMLNEDPTPKDGSADAARIGVLRKFVRESVLNAQQATGKKMTDAEIERHIDGLFAKSVSLSGWLNSSNVRMLGMSASDVPGDIKDKLRADFKALGIDNPTDADLLGAYWQMSALQ
jgi:soluble lytic murein transglycosylase